MKNNVNKQELLAYEPYAIVPHRWKTNTNLSECWICKIFSYIGQVSSDVGQTPRIHMLVMKWTIERRVCSCSQFWSMAASFLLPRSYSHLLPMSEVLQSKGDDGAVPHVMIWLLGTRSEMTRTSGVRRRRVQLDLQLTIPMIGENQQLVTDEPVEFEK